jgi:hypothetical protein
MSVPAPTGWEHQLPECSNTNWMESPTSSHTCTNLYNKEQWFSLAPPYHPDFSGYNQMEATTPLFKHPLETLRTTVLPRTTLPPLNINLCLLKFITVIQYLSMAYLSYHCSATPLCSACISVFLIASYCA